MTARPSVYHKLEAVAYKLNRDAYAMQMKGRKTALRHFTPCAKSLVVVEALYDKNALIYPTLERAAMVICPCHRGVTTDDLLGFMSEPTPFSENEK